MDDDEFKDDENREAQEQAEQACDLLKSHKENQIGE